MLEELTAQGYGDDNLEALGGHIGFADSVTVEQLAAAGVPNRTVFHLRRMLDPAAAAAEVCGSSRVRSGMHRGVYATDLLADVVLWLLLVSTGPPPLEWRHLFPACFFRCCGLTLPLQWGPELAAATDVPSD